MSTTSSLRPLDIHGIDEVGKYTPPSRARYEEMMATRDVLERRIDELQGHNTKLENQRRMWRARADVARALFTMIVVDVPLAHRLIGLDEPIEDVKTLLTETYDVHKRIDLLERDAWCGAAAIAKDFITAAEAWLSTSSGIHNGNEQMIAKWCKRFKDALENPELDHINERTPLSLR